MPQSVAVVDEPTIGPMTIPTRVEAAKILKDLDPPEWLLAHSAAVADVAAFLADAIDKRGHAINVSLVEAAALLHDLGKALPRDHPLRSFGHAEAAAHYLSDMGHGELADAIVGHPVTKLADDEHYAVWSRSATVDERVVAYADKRAKADLVPMQERFGYWIEKHGDTELMRVAFERAEILEQDVCAAAGLAPADVQRLRWADEALDEAGREEQG
jgi:putative nucleotidyltransferase with HDIG domain